MNTRRKVSKPSQTGEYDARLADVTVKLAEMMISMKLHIEADSKAFEASAESIKSLTEASSESIKSLIAEVKAVNDDVKTLLSARSIAFGAWKAAAIIGGIIVSLAGLYIAYESLVRATVTH